MNSKSKTAWATCFRTIVCALVISALARPAAAGTIWYWVGASNDWWNAASYSKTQAPGDTPNTQMPGSDDTLQLMEGQKVYVDDTTISFFSTIAQVHVRESNISAYFNLTTNANLGCYFGDLGQRSFTNSFIVKDGPGKLTLSKRGVAGTNDSGQNAYNYNVGLDIRCGDVVLEPAIATTTRHTYKDVIVGENCTLYCVDGGITWVETLAGSGNVTNLATAASSEFHITGVRAAPTVFSGVIGGFNIFSPHGHTYFTGMSNTGGSALRPYGYLGTDDVGITGFMTLAGPSTVPSSLGCGVLDFRYPARLLYLGNTGETIERDCAIWNTTSAPITWDAGAYGGLILTGTFDAIKGSSKQQRVAFTGSNTVVSVVSNVFKTVEGAGCSFHVTKQGSGTWRFIERDNNKLTGVVGAEEGVLEFDTLREVGLPSALGYATELYEDRCETVAAGLASAGYAHFLGGDGMVGTMRYLGNISRSIENRPIALKGAGRIEAPNCAVLKWKGVTGVGAGEKSLAIVCAEGQMNHFANITDGDGIVSIAKAGPGDLVLSGELSFGGDLSVSGGGTLTVRDISNELYRYYKLTLKETVGTSMNAAYSGYSVVYNDNSSANRNSRLVALNEFGLYNDAGTRQNTHTSETALSDTTAQLTPGHIAAEAEDLLVFWDNNNRDYRPWRLLDNGNAGGTHLCAKWKDMTKAPRLADPETWISVVMCIKDGADPITRYDLNFTSYPGEGGFIRTPTAFSIFGSADGLNYEELASMNDIMHTQSTWYSWLSDGALGVTTDHAMLPLPSSRVQTAYNVLNNVRSISVAAGASLKFEGASAPVVSGLSVDAVGGIGVIDGFSFATKGTVFVRSIAEGVTDIAIPSDFRNAVGLLNVKTWDVSIGGQQSSRYHVSSVSASEIRIVKRGFVMVFR